MTQRELLEFQVKNVSNPYVCPHDDTCHMCRVRRVMARVAERVLARTDIPDDKVLSEWNEAVIHEMKQIPSTN